MGFFVDKRKLTAAAGSMDQFLPVVRTIFGGDADDQAVEAITIYLYSQMAQQIFSKRFGMLVRRQLIYRLKFTTPTEVRTRLARIERHVTDFERAARAISPARTNQGNFENHIRSVVQSMLLEAGFRCDDAELVRETFQRFEEAVREIRRHLLGIKQQNYFVMR